jgi:MFS family permease
MSDITTRTKADLGVFTRSSRYPLSVFWVMYTINFLNWMDRSVFVGAANIIGKELGFGLAEIGILATAFTIINTLGAVPLGIWADRSTRKNIVAVSVAIWSLATAATAFANNFLTMLIARAVLGIGEAGYYPAGTALMSDYFSRSTRSRVMSRWNTAPLLGILVGTGAGGVIAGLYFGSWRLAFLFTGIPGLILTLLAWRLREPRRNEADEEATALAPQAPLEEAADAAHVIPTGIFAQFRSLLRIKSLVVLIILQIFAFFTLGVITFYPIYLQQKDALGLSSGVAGLLSGFVVVFGGSVGTIAGGYLADVLNRHHPGARIFVGGLGFLACAPSFVLMMIIPNFAEAGFFLFLTAVLIQMYAGPAIAAAQDVVPSALRASAVAIIILFTHLLGDAFAPQVVGVLAQWFDPTHGQHFLQSVAGNDLRLAFLVTCVPALAIAGLVGIFGARWMKDDIAAAERADKLARR